MIFDKFSPYKHDTIVLDNKGRIYYKHGNVLGFDNTIEDISVATMNTFVKRDTFKFSECSNIRLKGDINDEIYINSKYYIGKDMSITSSHYNLGNDFIDLSFCHLIYEDDNDYIVICKFYNLYLSILILEKRFIDDIKYLHLHDNIKYIKENDI